MLCYVSFFGIGIKAMWELDEIHSLLFSYVAYLNGLGFTTNQSKHLLHFSILTVKICVLNDLFFFLKSCPNQARTCYYPLQMVLRQMLCSQRHLSSVCVRKGYVSWALFKGLLLTWVGGSLNRHHTILPSICKNKVFISLAELRTCQRCYNSAGGSNIFLVHFKMLPEEWTGP